VTLLLSAKVLKERIAPAQIAGGMLAGAGFVVVAWHIGGEVSAQGLVCVLLAACSWGFANFSSKRLGRVNPLSLVVWGGLVVPGPMAVAALLFEGPELITQSLAPVVTALLAGVVLGQRVGARTWLAIAVAALGICAMYVFDVSGLDARHALGVLVALGVPLAAGINWVLLQRAGQGPDLSVAVLIGGTISAAVMLPLAWPLGVSAHDLGLLAVLGVFQLGVPCVLVMYVARHLTATETSLLALLEVVFGIVLTWLFSSERPGLATLVGGSAVLAALAYHELAARRESAPAGG
jgi:drug/metabolite transporter (DMT)-like permease